jgi:hypothetical protein
MLRNIIIRKMLTISMWLLPNYLQTQIPISRLHALFKQNYVKLMPILLSLLYPFLPSSSSPSSFSSSSPYASKIGQYSKIFMFSVSSAQYFGVSFSFILLSTGVE